MACALPSRSLSQRRAQPEADGQAMPRGLNSIYFNVLEEKATISTNQGFALPISIRVFVSRFWIGAQEGRSQDGIAKIRDALAGPVEAFAFREKVRGVAFLALALGKAGEVDHGLKNIDEALIEAKRTQKFADFYLIYLKGQLLLMKHSGGLRRAQQCFSAALEIARSRGAKSEELRAAIPLAKLMAQRGRHEQAYSMLKKIYSWFTEGFDTADLKARRAQFLMRRYCLYGFLHRERHDVPRAAFRSRPDARFPGCVHVPVGDRPQREVQKLILSDGSAA
jgi:tetratricopeptide (TPR) repeat protein